MCGIVGVSHFGTGERVDQDLLKRMNDLQVHRGPDDEGYFCEGSLGMAMRRLSIIDLSTGKQPIANEDESIWVVLNGEIYNFQALREELIAKGHRFKTKTDTEVIVHLYEEEGVECVRKLRGMFAFSLWDKKNERLMIARDRIGKKPLNFAFDGKRLAWASEIRSLLEVPWVSTDVDPRAIDCFLSLQYIPSPISIYRGVRKLPPAHRLVLENGRIRQERYWDLPIGQATPYSYEEAKVALLEKLKEATKLRMISDVPLGAFLSGGIDSSAVVAMMSEVSDRPVKTFAIGFDEAEFSELEFAKALAEHYGTDHTEFVVKANMAETLPKIAWQYGEPYADPSALPSYYVARETRKAVTVALNGDGGDENFGGYIRYNAMKAAAMLDYMPGPLLKAFKGFVECLPERDAPRDLVWRAKRFLRSAVFSDLPTRHLKMIGFFQEDEKDALLTDEMKGWIAAARREGLPEGDPTALGADQGPLHYIRKAFETAAAESGTNQILYVDFRTYLAENLMAKMDIATMTHSLEGRSPFLDHEFVEMVYRFPSHWKLKGIRGAKHILKDAMAPKLPEKINRRGKMGFGIPLGPWFRGELKDYWKELVLSDRAVDRGYFKRKGLQRLFDEHTAGKRDHGYRMWALLMLELWHQAYKK